MGSFCALNGGLCGALIEDNECVHTMLVHFENGEKCKAYRHPVHLKAEHFCRQIL